MTGMKKVIFVVLGIFALAAAYPVLFLLAGSLMGKHGFFVGMQ